MKNLIIILFILLPFSGFAQKGEDIKKFENLFAVTTTHQHWVAQVKDNRNEVSFIFSAFFVMYKELLSSQDIDACVFTPSCSMYAIESIKKKGVVVGYLNAIDRLTRCNPDRHKNLPVDCVTGKYYDPVE